MRRTELLSILAEAVSGLQEMSGLDRPEVTEQTKPLELEEFDSLKCVELEVLLTERLGFEVEDVLIPADAPEEHLSLSAIADRIMALAAEAST